MKGLLLKDYYVLKKQLPILLLMTTAFAFAGNSFSIYAIIYSALLPVTAIAYDERSKWDILASSMPYTIRQLVLSKYVLGWIMIIASSVVCAAAELIAAAVKNAAGFKPDFSYFSNFIGGQYIGVMLIALILPFVMKVGVEKARILYSILLGFCAAIIVTSRFFIDSLAQFVFGSSNLTAFIIISVSILLAVSVSILSIKISISFYKKKNRT